MPLENTRPATSDNHNRRTTRPENLVPDIAEYYREEVYKNNPIKNKSYRIPLSVPEELDDYDEFTPNYSYIDKNTRTFKYGIHGVADAGRGAVETEYEDPTMLGFTFEMDESNSALFNAMPNFIDKYGVYYPEIKSRKVVWQRFIEMITHFMKSRDSGPYYKYHYISKVKGLDKVFKRFVEDYERESYIEVEMMEDVKMTAQYLSSLYNNLTWSYKNMKRLMPENLEYFDLLINIAEIRQTNTQRILMEDAGDTIGTMSTEEWTKNVKTKMTYMIYRLHDCKFDFSEAKSHDDEMTIGGFNASNPDLATMEFKIWFKSVSRVMNPSLIYSDFQIDDLRTNLGIVIKNATSPQPTSKDPRENRAVGLDGDVKKEPKDREPMSMKGDEDVLNTNDTSMSRAGGKEEIQNKPIKNNAEKISENRKRDFKREQQAKKQAQENE